MGRAVRQLYCTPVGEVGRYRRCFTWERFGSCGQHANLNPARAPAAACLAQGQLQPGVGWCGLPEPARQQTSLNARRRPLTFDLVKPRAMRFLVKPRSAVNWVACVESRWKGVACKVSNDGNQERQLVLTAPAPTAPAPTAPPRRLALMSSPAVSTAPEESLDAFLLLPTVLAGCGRGQGRTGAES